MWLALEQILFHNVELIYLRISAIASMTDKTFQTPGASLNLLKSYSHLRHTCYILCSYPIKHNTQEDTHSLLFF